MAEHTPGPWSTSKDAVPAGYVQVTVYEEATGRRVATAFEQEANAYLIAAAPELLAALREVVAVLEHELTRENGLATADAQDLCPELAAARAALAKATAAE